MPSVSQRLISIEVLIFNFRPFVVIDEPGEIIQDHMAISELASQDFQQGLTLLKYLKGTRRKN